MDAGSLVLSDSRPDTKHTGKLRPIKTASREPHIINNAQFLSNLFGWQITETGYSVSWKITQIKKL